MTASETNDTHAWRIRPNNSVNSDAQLRSAPVGAGYAGRYAKNDHRAI
jgi:phage-related protein